MPILVVVCLVLAAASGCNGAARNQAASESPESHAEPADANAAAAAPSGPSELIMTISGETAAIDGEHEVSADDWPEPPALAVEALTEALGERRSGDATGAGPLLRVRVEDGVPMRRVTAAVYSAGMAGFANIQFQWLEGGEWLPNELPDVERRTGIDRVEPPEISVLVTPANVLVGKVGEDRRDALAPDSEGLAEALADRTNDPDEVVLEIGAADDTSYGQFAAAWAAAEAAGFSPYFVHAPTLSVRFDDDGERFEDP